MNKRINELAIAANQMEPRLRFSSENGYESHQYLQRFAELIIEDCLCTISNGGEYVNRVKLVEQLKSHFGVE